MSIDNAQMLHYLINFFYPPRCAACDARLGSGAVQRLCKDCHSHIDPILEPLCDICGIPLAAKPLGTPADSVECCTSCLNSPPHFTRARAVVRYSHSAAENDRVVVPLIVLRHKAGLCQ